MQELFMRELAVDEEIASILAQEGFTSIEEIAYVPEDEVLRIEEFDDKLVQELRTRAKDRMLTRILSEEVKLMDVDPPEQLLALEGMDRELAYRLASQEITSPAELAELDVDELVSKAGREDMHSDRAGALIMAARTLEGWFDETSGTGTGG